ncbi:hypothetical protein KG088_04695 [Halomonas sp. TRM85114]|uniref:hypothetical protein n=1 Tax=Halomonas jincaotanensis TaxID=2810616 RepID=UPI001BD388C5|nr:hypothetical protein [Halomonas jincaotanensis]MBS9402920.1 hypothetical protein [Halomonas jincaotanensis]
MLGSDRVPRYFPASFAEIDRDVLIAALSVGTVGFFLLYLLAERMIAWVTSLSTSRLLAMSQKMVLFENQEELAASSYQRYSRALASGVFIALALFGLGWFYPWMSLVITSYFFMVLVLFWGLHEQSPGFRERLESKLPQTLTLAGGVGFFIAFGFLVADFIFWSPPGVIIAIVSLLLSRQIMQRASGMIGDLASLRRQQLKLDALFFHGKVLLPQQTRPEKSLWPLLVPGGRQAWVAAVLNKLVGPEEGNVVCRWHQLGIPNVVGLIVKRGERQFLIKLFEINRSSWALHEATLMAEPASRLSAPRWVGATQVEKFHCLIFELPQGEQPQVRQVKRLSQQLLGELLAAQPHPDAVKRYLRSRPLLWQRLELSLVERLRVAADTAEQQEDLAMLLEQLPLLQQQLKALPVVLHNPEINQDAIWVPTADTGQSVAPILLNWGRWSLEPVGSGWPEAQKPLAKLGDALQLAVEQRAELGDIRVEQAELAALAFALERECNRQRYVQALELLPRLLERLATLEAIVRPGAVNAE